MKNIGLNDLQNVTGVAVLKGDMDFSNRMRDEINKRIQIEISEEDYDYIMKNYTRKD